MSIRSLIHVLLAVACAYLIAEFVPADRSVRLGLALFAAIAWLWISEALHISVTALLVPIIASLMGLVEVREGLSNFANPVIFLFMGGFALAAALQKYELDRMFAMRVIGWSGESAAIAILLLFLVTALLSMWISNTATVAMMLPIAAGLLSGHDPKTDHRLYLFVLLGIAYAGNIGGMATLIGSPPNAIAASIAGLSFRDWLGYGLPAFGLLFPLMIALLYVVVRPRLDGKLTIDDHAPPPDRRRGHVLLIFGMTAAGWVLSAPLSSAFGLSGGFDALVAMTAIAVLIATGCLSFDEFSQKTHWDILILFGGGLTLSAIMQRSGASAYLADALMTHLPIDNPLLLLVIVCLFVIFLTELVSNTASAALLIPLFATAATGFGLSGDQVAVMIALGASCAFMLPVATPPNALVFSTGHVPQRQMMRVGVCLNLLFALVLALFFRVITS